MAVRRNISNGVRARALCDNEWVVLLYKPQPMNRHKRSLSAKALRACLSSLGLPALSLLQGGGLSLNLMTLPLGEVPSECEADKQTHGALAPMRSLMPLAAEGHAVP